MTIINKETARSDIQEDYLYMLVVGRPDEQAYIRNKYLNKNDLIHDGIIYTDKITHITEHN